MDQKKNQGQQSEGSGNRPQGSQRAGQQNWNEKPQTQSPNRDQAEGPRQQDVPGRDRSGQQSPPGSPEFEPDRHKGPGSEGERNRAGGITNRDLDTEMEEQEELPDRGSSQSER